MCFLRVLRVHVHQGSSSAITKIYFFDRLDVLSLIESRSAIKTFQKRFCTKVVKYPCNLSWYKEPLLCSFLQGSWALFLRFSSISPQSLFLLAQSRAIQQASKNKLKRGKLCKFGPLPRTGFYVEPKSTNAGLS